MEGRWTMVLGSGGELLAAHEGAATEDYEGLTPMPAVPCDDAAIERVVKVFETELGIMGSQPRALAELALRAAGETP